MGITTKTLGELLDKIDREQLQLPEIQREFVWSKKSVKLLFDSLYRNLPIGQMLVWKPKDTIPQSKSFLHKRQRRSPATIDSFYGYLLDGQQRLTAISRVRDGDDEYPLRIDLWPEKSEEDEVFFWGRFDDSNPWYPAVADILSSEFNLTAHLKRLTTHEDYKEKYAEPVRKTLTQLQDILKYDMSVIEFESDNYKKATELFIRFNSTGKKLNLNDLALADLATRVPGLTSKEMGKVLDRWKPHFQFTRPFLIQCLAAVHTGRMDLKRPKAVWGESSSDEIRESWSKTARGLGEVLKLLTGTVRWNSGTWVPSFTALIPLVYVLARKDNLSESERSLARSWLLLTGVKAYFSGSTYTELDQLLRKLHDKRTVNQLWGATRKRLGILHPEDFETTRRSSPVMSLFISMLRNGNAQDWLAGTPLDGTVLGQNAQLHVHHFFPKALLTKHGYGSSEINTFANFTILSADTNFDIGEEEPATYLERLHPSRKDLEAQCIPMNPKLLSVSRYEDFITARRKLLAVRSNEFLGLK